MTVLTVPYNSIHKQWYWSLIMSLLNSQRIVPGLKILIYNQLVERFGKMMGGKQNISKISSQAGSKGAKLNKIPKFQKKIQLS